MERYHRVYRQGQDWSTTIVDEAGSNDANTRAKKTGNLVREYEQNARTRRRRKRRLWRAASGVCAVTSPQSLDKGRLKDRAFSR